MGNLIAEIFGTEEVLETQFHHAKEKKCCSLKCSNIFGTEEVTKYDEIIKEAGKFKLLESQREFLGSICITFDKRKGKTEDLC